MEEGNYLLNRSRLFISYCHENIDRSEVDLLSRWIEEIARPHLEVICDTKLTGGENLNSLMSLIYDVDGIIVLCTPAYKRKSLSEDHLYGVAYEYSLIRKRLIERDQLKKELHADYEERNFYICPVIFSGDFKRSVPEDFRQNFAIDLRRLRSSKDRNGNLNYTKTLKKEFQPIIEKIVSNILAVHTLRTPNFKESRMEIFDKLFLATRFEMSPLDVSIIVKTSFFNNVAAQTSLFLVGRKGSGKTTLAKSLRSIKPDSYKGTVEIFAEDFDLELIYNVLYNEWQLIKDINTVFSYLQLLDIFWDIYIYIFVAYIIYNEGINGRLSAKQMKYFEAIKQKFDEILYLLNNKDKDNKSIISQTFYYATIDKLTKYLKTGVFEKANYDNLYSSIPLALTINSVRDYIFGENFTNSLLEILKLCTKKILVTLDGFDIKFERFRSNTQKYIGQEHYIDRTNFEIDWLCALLEYVLNKKYDSISDIFAKSLEFCIAIPQDRFLEIRSKLRDFHKYRPPIIISMNWSGIELIILVRKRLEALYQYQTKTGTPYEKLMEVMKKCLPQIPITIFIYIDDHPHEIDLFFYILRFSFWRPRDILRYYNSIISAVLSSPIKNEKKLFPEMIKRVIKETSFKIIDDEFIQEFSRSFKNIKMVLSKFNNGNQIMTEEELVNILNDVEFNIIEKKAEIDINLDVNNKISILYELGFLGIETTEKYRRQHNLTNEHIFIFTEGIAGIRGLKNNLMLGSRFLIHPIFIEYLNLNINTECLICDYNLEYLETLEMTTKTGVLEFNSGAIDI